MRASKYDIEPDQKRPERRRQAVARSHITSYYAHSHSRMTSLNEE
jgi:hypothetical protein